MGNGITRWHPFSGFTSEPFSEMLSLRNAMDRLLQDAFVWPSELLGRGGVGSGFAYVPLDLYETENDCVVTAAVPGLRPEDIDISVQGNVLTLKGESRAEEESSQGTYHLRERRYGSFLRQIQLPVPVETEGAEAKFDNGILTLRLPKAAEARERKIQVSAGSPKAKPGKAA